jgi:modulator of FtsH protease HflK
MSWNDNQGGGRNGGGPWGQAPGGGGGSGGGGGPRRPGGPSLEDILNQGRDRFRGGVPGGKWGLAAIGLLALVFWGFQSIYIVQPQEIGVELVFGKPKPVFSEPGLQFQFWPIEQVEKVAITENETRIGSVAQGRGVQSAEGLMLSGDQNIVDVAFSVLWRVSNASDFLFNVRDPDGMVRRAAESAMREVVGRRTAQDVFRDDRAGIELAVQGITQTILDNYVTGVSITQITIEDVAPPTEVADAFDEVQRARQDEDRFQEEARQYSNTQLGGARGQAAQIREDAAAYKDRVVKEAEGEAARFISVYDEYARAPEVTRKRLYLETMEQVLARSNKVIIEGGPAGSGVVPYLPLPELQARAARTN